MKYLIFNNKKDAIARSDEAGAAKGLPYHTSGGTTRYVWWATSEEGGEERAALEIENNLGLLTAEETSALVDELPEGWVRGDDDA